MVSPLSLDDFTDLSDSLLWYESDSFSYQVFNIGRIVVHYALQVKSPVPRLDCEEESLNGVKIWLSRYRLAEARTMLIVDQL